MGMKSKGELVEGEEFVRIADLYGYKYEYDDLYEKERQFSVENEIELDDKASMGSPDQIQLLKKEIISLKLGFEREFERSFAEQERRIEVLMAENQELESKLAQVMKTSSDAGMPVGGSADAPSPIVGLNGSLDDTGEPSPVKNEASALYFGLLYVVVGLAVVVM